MTVKLSPDELAELKSTIREAHEVMKDMRALIKEAKLVTAEMHNRIVVDLDNTLGSYVKEGLDKYRDALDSSIKESVDSIYKRFNYITEILLMETKAEKRAGVPNMHELVEAYSTIQRSMKDSK